MKTYFAHKNQVQGFGDVAETVKTVEKIAASSVHFLKYRVANLERYEAEIEKILFRLSLFYRDAGHPLLKKKETGGKALLILTGDKGLVGGLWHKVINAYLSGAGKYREVIVFGAKGESYLGEERVAVAKAFFGPEAAVSVPEADGAGTDDAFPAFDSAAGESVRRITDYIFSSFMKDEFSAVDILYPRFISLAEQQPFCVPFLPFTFSAIKGLVLDKDNRRKAETEEVSSGLPIFEPAKKVIFGRMLSKYIAIFFHKIMIETELSELSARTVEMEHAAAKTNELIRKLSADYAKERRRALTQKQLESFAVHNILKSPQIYKSATNTTNIIPAYVREFKKRG
jgi:F-type H+-transporting ATPase subunit gamma